MSKNCIEHYRQQVTSYVKEHVRGQYNTSTNKAIFIPSGKGKYKTLASTRIAAERYSKEINEAFQGHKVTSVNRTLTNGTEINIHVPNTLLKQYLLKQDETLWRQDETNYEPDYFAPEDNIDVVSPEFSKFYEYQKQLTNNLINRRNYIRQNKKNTNLSEKEIQNYIKEEKKITDVLEGTEDSIGMLARVKKLETISSLDEFDYYLQKDLERIETLKNSHNYQDIAELTKILEFFKELGTFSTKQDHLLFKKKDLFDGNGNILIQPEVVKKFEGYKAYAKKIENQIHTRKKASVLSMVNENSRVKKIADGKEFTYKDLFYEDGGLADINWADMFVMDVTNGIFSHNGIIPQVMMSILQDTIERNLVKAKEIEQDVDKIMNEVTTALRAEGQTLSDKGIIGGRNGVSYDMFRARDKYGNYKDAVIQRYTDLYATELRKEMVKFFKAFDNFKENKSQEGLDTAYRIRNNWHKKNSYLIDLAAIPELRDNPKFEKYKDLFKADSEYRNKLIADIGENAYNEAVKKQEDVLDNYEKMHRIVIEEFLANESVEKVEQLSERSKFLLGRWEKTNNPFTFVESYKTENSAEGTMKFNITIPRKHRRSVTNTASGLAYSTTKELTGYLDPNFEKIDSNEALKNFHDIILKFQNTIFNALPIEVRERFNKDSLPALEKTIVETLFDPDKTFSFADGKEKLFNKIRSALGENIMDGMSTTNIDPITGKSNYAVNDSFLQTNKKEISLKYNIEIERLKKAFGVTSKKIIARDDIFNVESNQEATNILLEISGSNNLTELSQKYPDVNFKKIALGEFVNSLVTHQVVAEKSFDLPKMIKLFSFLTMEYAGRQEALPYITMLKEHYNEIKSPETTKEGRPIFNLRRNETQFEGLRANANKQMESWFHRAVLGNYNSKSELKDSRIKRNAQIVGNTTEDEKSWFKKILNTTITGKMMNKDEKLLKKKLDSVEENLQTAIKEETDAGEIEFLKKRLTYFQQNKEKLGKEFTLASGIDSIFNFIRFKGLGWNLSSYVTNYMEGQTANFIVAASGDYFTPDNIYRAINITKGSFIKNITWGKKATPEARKLRILMDRYRILQDASNELQKATTKSTFASLKKFSPYEGIQRVEYLNQSPLMISILMDIEVTGKDGTKSNIWDAIGEDGKMLENFSTPANVEAWENANHQDYNDFKSKITKVIVNAHGDYDQLRGNMASEYITGKALQMFKRWMSRQFYQRFAVEQPADIEAGLSDFKGRYRSHTAATGALEGAIIGFGGLSLLSFGLPGILIGGGIGLAAGKFFGANSNMGFLQELSFATKELFLNLIRIPVNTLSGKPRIKSGVYDKLLGDEFSSRDLKNFRSNLVEMSILLAHVAMLLFVKSLLLGDEEDEDKELHNLLANRFMQLSSQSSMYLDPVETWSNTLGNVPIMKFFGDVSKLGMETADLLAGRDILAGGTNAGESAFYNQFEKTFLPGIFKSNLGFSAQMEREFVPSKFNPWFESEEKSAKLQIRRMRAEYRAEISDQYETKKDVERAVNKKFNKKKSGQSNSDLLKSYEEQE